MAAEQNFQVAYSTSTEGMAQAISHFQTGQDEKRQPSCCGLFPRRKQEKPPDFKQVVVLLRHADRLDAEDPEKYFTSPEGMEWPHDTPITDAGKKRAREVAKELANYHAEANFVAVACSPYRRCLETAAEVSKALRLPVIIDQELGELYEKHMGEQPWRSNQELPKLIKSVGIENVLNPMDEDGSIKLFGKRPNFPEYFDDGRLRFMIRTEHYIKRSAHTQQNFIICTHADCVNSALNMFQRGNLMVDHMDFCARVIARYNVRTSMLSASSIDSSSVTPSTASSATPSSEYAKNWQVEYRGITASQCDGTDTPLAKYYEHLHLESCSAASMEFAKRKDKKTLTDHKFDDVLKKKLREIPDAALQIDEPDRTSRPSGRSVDSSEIDEVGNEASSLSGHPESTTTCPASTTMGPDGSPRAGVVWEQGKRDASSGITFTV